MAKVLTRMLTSVRYLPSITLRISDDAVDSFLVGITTLNRNPAKSFSGTDVGAQGTYSEMNSLVWLDATNKVYVLHTFLPTQDFQSKKLII
jgi:hypothetical protein